MSSYIRDAPLGSAIRFLTGNKYLQSIEELPGFEFRLSQNTIPEKKDAPKASSDESEQDIPVVAEKDLEAQKHALATPPLQVSATETKPDLGLESDIIIVDWYSQDDPENPQNWTDGKKAFTTLLIWYFTSLVQT
jgi:DHA1 family multidrug resistance protein-like MFS transporter